MATLEQRRAAFALARVQSVSADAQIGKFKTWLIKLPALLHNNGLGATVAFYLAAGPGKPEQRICGWLGEWLRAPAGGGGVGIYPQGVELIEAVTGRTFGDDQVLAESRYRLASIEARALAVWLKRFAEAFLAGEAE